MTTLKIHDNCLVTMLTKPSGIPGLTTVEIYQRFPHAQHPRDQRILQLNLTE